MRNLEQEAKKLLIARLDDCLLDHAAAICADGRPAIKDVYELQDLSALHYYLKAEHEFTPAEVEALLEFKDPLNVARWCSEDNTHAHSFPICELLNEINAYERFELLPKDTPQRPKSLRERLQHAAQEVKERPGAEKTTAPEKGNAL